MVKKMWYTLKKVIVHLATPNLTPYRFQCLGIAPERIVLPNGMSLRYPELHWDNKTRQYLYKSRNTWVRLYGGKLLENIIQALSRITMTNAMIEMDNWFQQQALYGELALTVHDELVAVCAAQLAEATDRAMDTALTRIPNWMDNRIKLASKGGISDCYNK